MLRYCILDCFVDEPACFGVPPFISPYPRYIFGALLDAGVSPDAIAYLTIDDCRETGYLLEERYKAIFLIGGAVVPGKYLGSRIGTAAEIRRITGQNPGQRFAVGGLISRVFEGEDNLIPVLGDIEKYAYHCALGAQLDARRTPEEVARWARSGAAVVRRHPRFPHVICEVETYRGCPRDVHCSFCSEGLFSPVEYRDEEDIIGEIDALSAAGVSRFRLGRQADILQYKADFTVSRKGFPKPVPERIGVILAALRSRIAAGAVTVLNIDNANPGTVANYPEESSVILSDLAATVTPGDTLALGIESFDEAVVLKNNLKVMPDDAVRAIDIINRTAGGLVGPFHALLPGVNLIHGLAGETAETFATNYRYLSEILERGLLVKRINIRQLLPFPGTPLYEKRPRVTSAVENRFRYYREKIRSEIELPMLKKIYPTGTIIRESQVLDTRAGYSYGKQIASYSITAKFPLPLETGAFYDALVIAHRERSLIALPLPVDLNTLPQKAIELIPGIGKRRAAEIVMRRPFTGIAELVKMLDGVEEKIRKAIVPE
jgi:radical SAM superfamily enzyme with C-terminal helix-hairpin-helix motif